MTERQILIVSHTAREEAVDATREAIAALHAAGVTPVLCREDREQFAPSSTSR